MSSAKILGLVVLAAAVAVTGCTPKADDTKDKGAGKTDHRHGKGKDGVVFDLGKHHSEFWVDHGKKEVYVRFLGDDEKTPTPVACDELTVTTKEAKTKDGTVVKPMTIKLTPKDKSDGKASMFAGTDPGVGFVADFEGTVTGVIDGKPSKGDFKED